MALAQIGPLTSLIESAAAAVGAGMLLGSFALGIQGLLRKLSAQGLERWALRGGYFGGVAGVLVILADIMIRYTL